MLPSPRLRVFPPFTLSLLLGASVASAAPQFGPAELINATAVLGVRSAVSLDANLDGRPDIVCTADFYGPLRLFLGQNLPGNPSDEGRRVEVPGIDSIDILHVADFDGDGNQDLLTCTAESGQVAWLPVVGGDSFFGAPRTITFDAHGAEDLGTGDIDGDGRIDVVVSAKDRGVIVWFRNLGAGQFDTEAMVTPSQYQSSAIEVIDADGDGDLDVFTNSELSGFHWYRNLGGGVFSPQIVLEFRMDTATEVLGGDLDNDGDVDYVGVGEVEGESGKLLLYEGDGTGGFSTIRRTLLTGPEVRTATLLDVDDDGDLDIVFQDQSAFMIKALLNEGGTFTEVDLFSSSGLLDRLTIADTDGDGRLDLLSRRHNFVRPIRNAGPLNLEAAPRVTEFGLSTPLAFTDVTGDGRRDLLFLGTVAVRPSQGDGQFGRAIYSAGTDEFYAGLAKDFDGDGIEDLIGGLDTGTSQRSLAWCRALGDGTFLPPLTLPVAPSDINLAFFNLADLDGDGDLDLYGGVKFSSRTFWIENQGASQAWTYHALPSFSRPENLIALDLSQDGLPELVVRGSTFTPTEGLGLYQNLGGGSFGPLSIVVAEHVGFGADSVGDFDGDGLLDLAFLSDQPASYHYLPSDGQGAFGLPVNLGPWGNLVGDPVAIDWDDDGDDDLVQVAVGGSSPAVGLGWFENLGSAFAAPSLLLDGMPESPDLAVTKLFPFFDLDEDGDPDVVWGEGFFTSTSYLAWRRNERSVGSPYCTAVPNSTGAAATLTATGTRSVGSNQLTLMASDLPQNVFGFFIASPTQGFVAMPGDSLGNICLQGSVSRYSRSGEARFSGGSGAFSLSLDLTDTPTPSGTVSILAGETWNYQAWYRNLYQGFTSNFSSALSVSFR